MSEDRKDIGDLIRRFVDGMVGPYEWDDFISVLQKDAELETVLLDCASIPTQYPAATGSCSPAGIAKLKSIADGLSSAN